MAEEAENLNPITGKKRTKSNGTELGDQTEAFYAAEKPEEKLAVLKKYPELQKHFRLSDFADLDTP